MLDDQTTRKHRSRRLAQIASHALTLALVGTLGYYLWANWAQFVAGMRVSTMHLVLVGLCVFGTWFVSAAQSTILLRAQGVRSGFAENLLVQNAAILTNYLPLRAGTVLRFQYFKTVHAVEYSRLGGMSAIRVAMLVAATAMTSLIGLAMISSTVSAGLWALYGGLFLSGIAAWFVSRLRYQWSQSRLGRFADSFLDGYRTLADKPAAVLMTLGLMILQFAILAVRLAICLDAVGQSVSLPSLLLLAPAATLLSFITITPGNLGLREWVIGAISAATGYPVAGGVFAATLDRSVLTVCSIVFGVPALLWTFRRIRLAA